MFETVEWEHHATHASKMPALRETGQLVPRMGSENTGDTAAGNAGECSNVSLDKALYSLAAVAAIAGAVFFVLFVTLVQEFSFTSLVLIAVPFLLFFLISPFFVRLRPIQPAKMPPAPGQMHDTQRVDLPRGGQRQSQAPGRTARGATQRRGIPGAVRIRGRPGGYSAF